MKKKSIDLSPHISIKITDISDVAPLPPYEEHLTTENLFAVQDILGLEFYKTELDDIECMMEQIAAERRCV